VREWGEREGGSGKKGRQGEAFLRARLSREEVRRCQLSFKFRELLIPLQR